MLRSAFDRAKHNTLKNQKTSLRECSLPQMFLSNICRKRQESGTVIPGKIITIVVAFCLGLCP